MNTCTLMASRQVNIHLCSSLDVCYSFQELSCVLIVVSRKVNALKTFACSVTFWLPSIAPIRPHVCITLGEWILQFHFNFLHPRRCLSFLNIFKKMGLFSQRRLEVFIPAHPYEILGVSVCVVIFSSLTAIRWLACRTELYNNAQNLVYTLFNNRPSKWAGG